MLRSNGELIGSKGGTHGSKKSTEESDEEITSQEIIGNSQ
jgi:hypothetical protein